MGLALKGLTGKLYLTNALIDNLLSDGRLELDTCQNMTQHLKLEVVDKNFWRFYKLLNFL